jgi:hypothetical protein
LHLLESGASDRLDYPKYGPRFFYLLTLLLIAGRAYWQENTGLLAAALTLWFLVMLPKLLNGSVILWRMTQACYARFITQEPFNPLLASFQATAVTSDDDPFGAVIDLVQKHSWAVPTKSAIDLILTQGKIVEVCAGTGYWAWLLWQCGGNIVAYDVSPGLRVRNRFHRLKFSWFPVRKGDGAEAAAKHTDRALLLCWPTWNDMSHEALQKYAGDTVIYIGANEGNLCITGSERFHRELAKNWELVAEEIIPCWGQLKDSVRVFKRKTALKVSH